MNAVSASGLSSMSDASMPFQPAIDEPSKAWPLSNLSSSNAETGTETCCSLPRVSVKRRSTNLTSSFLMRANTEALIVVLDVQNSKIPHALNVGGSTEASCQPSKGRQYKFSSYSLLDP